jgi:hypothetical protein
MKLSQTLLFFCLISGCIMVLSCKKSTENKLEGTWKLIRLDNIDDSINGKLVVEKWQFGSDGLLKIFTDINGVADTFPNSILTYKVDSYKKLKIDRYDASSPDLYCTDWEIDKLNKDVLIMRYKSGGLVQKEFEKM